MHKQSDPKQENMIIKKIFIVLKEQNKNASSLHEEVIVLGDHILKDCRGNQWLHHKHTFYFQAYKMQTKVCEDT
jgi:hypothetical protein